MQHILSARQFNPKQLDALFACVNDMRLVLQDPAKRQQLARRYVGKIAATLFYEPSTRTRFSFESAAQRLGAGVVTTENAAEFSSASKGETLEDTIRVVATYADVIILRHPETGAAERAASVSGVPVINAGDGKGEHPTQALLDLYTIWAEKHRLDNLRVVIGGDLAHGRTARSLTQLLCLYPNNVITFVSTPELQIGSDIKAHLRQGKTKYSETDDLFAALSGADVVYWTRLQKERLANTSLKSGFVIDERALKHLQKDALIMHPLPRVDEIEPAVDADSRAAYFRQAQNGLYVRMTLLDELLSA